MSVAHGTGARQSGTSFIPLGVEPCTRTPCEPQWSDVSDVVWVVRSSCQRHGCLNGGTRLPRVRNSSVTANGQCRSHGVPATRPDCQPRTTGWKKWGLGRWGKCVLQPSLYLRPGGPCAGQAQCSLTAPLATRTVGRRRVSRLVPLSCFKHLIIVSGRRSHILSATRQYPVRSFRSFRLPHLPHSPLNVACTFGGCRVGFSGVFGRRRFVLSPPHAHTARLDFGATAVLSPSCLTTARSSSGLRIRGMPTRSECASTPNVACTFGL
ncbi:hypothetical protein LXA43DRAFT_130499 [Ganoderma leucocontextum]|nr:hypothetical protein LXA43DRAFT_130499 [Ganoderma leucocontextum]